MAARAATLQAPKARPSLAPGIAIGVSTLYLSIVEPLPLAALDTGAYASAVVLALIAVATLIVMTALKPKEETR